MTSEATPGDATLASDDFSQEAMIHRLPKAKVVDRIAYLTDLVRGRRVVHVGFVDAGCRTMQEGADAWLHGHLDRVAGSLVGIDVDEAGVASAVGQGYEAYAVDCRDAEAVAALGLQPAEIVLAGEVIEHLDDVGSFLDGLHALVAPDGWLVLTTPNATGLLNSAAALAGYELNHPDHVVVFTWRTLSNLLGRHGWQVVAARTFVPVVKTTPGRGVKLRVLAGGARLACFTERLLGRLGAPFVADGLIVVARPAGRR